MPAGAPMMAEVEARMAAANVSGKHTVILFIVFYFVTFFAHLDQHSEGDGPICKTSVVCTDFCMNKCCNSTTCAGNWEIRVPDNHRRQSMNIRLST